MARKFEFKKTYEELEIAGETYRVNFDDESLKRYQKEFNEFYHESRKNQEIDVTKLTQEEQLEVFNHSQEILKKLVENILGEGAYAPIYEASGRSTMEMLDLAEYLSEIIGEKMETVKKTKNDKYLKNKKKKQ